MQSTLAAMVGDGMKPDVSAMTLVATASASVGDLPAVYSMSLLYCLFLLLLSSHSSFLFLLFLGSRVPGLLEAMGANGIAADEYFYTRVMNGFIKNNHTSQVREFAQFLKNLNVSIERFVLYSIISTIVANVNPFIGFPDTLSKREQQVFIFLNEIAICVV